MKKIFLILIIALLSKHSFSQNLVINGDFENYITCPGFGQFGLTWISNWTKPSYGSTDYYHANCPGILPVQQTPFSGSAYCGLIGYNFGTEYREYATGELSTPLIAGVSYLVEFKVSLNDGYIQAIDELGAYFSATVPGPYTNSLHIPVVPQIQNTSGTLSSTTNWMTVSGSFIASGGEQFITLGNFNNDSNTTVTQVGNIGTYGSYYFIDDVSVFQQLESVEEVDGLRMFLYPNPVQNTLHFLHNMNSKLLEFKVFDVIGHQIDFSINPDSDEINFNPELKTGVYFLHLYYKENKFTRSFVKL